CVWSASAYGRDELRWSICFQASTAPARGSMVEARGRKPRREPAKSRVLTVPPEVNQVIENAKKKEVPRSAAEASSRCGRAGRYANLIPVSCFVAATFRSCPSRSRSERLRRIRLFRILRLWASGAILTVNEEESPHGHRSNDDRSPFPRGGGARSRLRAAAGAFGASGPPPDAAGARRRPGG